MRFETRLVAASALLIAPQLAFAPLGVALSIEEFAATALFVCASLYIGLVTLTLIEMASVLFPMEQLPHEQAHLALAMLATGLVALVINVIVIFASA